ncbi:hypothetical protein WMF18_29270 [Sorangium sp. So ce315]|uniref:hypothetical protein n=1 Tax=Sorangium sp. So ce315 TaxID=3133299 RepID=UPI003F5F332A
MSHGAAAVVPVEARHDRAGASSAMRAAPAEVYRRKCVSTGTHFPNPSGLGCFT